jgi:hypothetical protein
MKIQAMEIRMGDRILAYCNNKQQICTVRQVDDSGQGSIALTVCPSENYRLSLARVIRFQRDALVDLSSKNAELETATEEEVELEVELETI